MQGQEMIQALEHDVITGFSYSFTKLLLEKLKGLMERKEMVKISENPNWYKHKEYNGRFCHLPSTILFRLSEQIPGAGIDCTSGNKKEVETLIETTEAFLAIFEEKKENTSIPLGIFTVRARNLLRKMEVYTWTELANLTEKEILSYQFIGKTTLRELKMELAKMGLSFKKSDDQ